MPFVIAPLKDTKGNNGYNEYIDALRDLQNAGIHRAQQIWNGYNPGGLYPGDKEFGITQLRANEMANDVTATTLSGTYAFRKNIGATGWRTMFNYTTRKDVLHAFAGFAVSDEALRILQIRFEIGDRIYPIIDLHEAKLYESFAILFKEDEGNELIAEPETRVLIKAYCDSTGFQTFFPLGFQLYKRKDLVITET